MRVEFDVNMTTGKMYDYMLRHTFTSFAGVLGELLGILLVAGAFIYSQWIYFVFGVICIFYQPVALYWRSKRQVNNTPAFKEPLHYVLDEAGITVKSGENTESLAWEKMYKAVSTSKSVILYTNRVSACIFPKEDLGDKKEEVIRFISSHMDPKQVNIR